MTSDHHRRVSAFAIAALVGAATALGHSPPADAVTACDRVAAPDGSNLAAGTEAAPFRTAQRLVNSLAPGETGCLRAGTYSSNEEVRVRTADVALTSYPGEEVTLRGRLLVEATADGAVIEDLVLDGRNPRNLLGPVIYANEVVLRGNDISNGNTQTCVFVNRTPDFPAPSGVVIDDNRIHDCGALPATNQHHGIFLKGSRDAVVRDNWIYDNADRGVQLYPDADGTRLVGNVIDGNGQGIIFGSDTLTSPDQNTVEGNMITNSRIRYNVQSHSQGAPYGQGNVVRRNCIHGGARDDGDGGIQSPQRGFTATDNVIAAPLYVDRTAKNFELRADSPCLSLLGEPEPPPAPWEGMTPVREDDGTSPSPLPLWGAIDAADPSRHEHRVDEAQPYRRMTVLDGDDFYGERAELGRTTRNHADTFQIYREGERKLTYLRYRLPGDFPINTTSNHQSIFQMKVVGGSSYKGDPPLLALSARQGVLALKHNLNGNKADVWSTTPQLGQWFEVAFDITYTQNAQQARIVPWFRQGDDWQKFAPITGIRTLPVETQAGMKDPVGSSVPLHLRAGIYHAPSIGGSHVDLGPARVYE